MPHRHRLRCSALWGAVVALATIGACSPDRGGELTVMLDSTPAPRSVEALLLPVDPATLPRAMSARPLARSTADSVATYRRLADSADRLDRGFQMLRDSLNRAAAVLSAQDRRTRAYAAHYFAFRRREMSAESLRAQRDRVRPRVAQLRSRLAAVMDDPPAESERRRLLDTLRSESRRTRALAVTSRATTGSLEPGTWWVGVARRGAVPGGFERVLIRPGVHDTVRLSVGATH